MGIFLGLLVMWLVFDQSGIEAGGGCMRELFASNLMLMAELATPWPNNQKTDLRRVRALRDKISQNFSAVNAQVDGVLFELGRLRAESLQCAIYCSAGNAGCAAFSWYRSRFCSTGRGSTSR